MAATNVFNVSSDRKVQEIFIFIGTGVPATGDAIVVMGYANIGSQYTDLTTGLIYTKTADTGAGADWVNSAASGAQIANSTKFTPVTTNTITAAAGQNVIAPAGTIAALTINMPASPANGTLVSLYFTHVVTALTMATTDGSTLVSGLTASTVGETAAWVYSATDTTWYPAA